MYTDKVNRQEKKGEKEEKKMKGLYSLLFECATIILLILVAFSFIFGVHRNIENAMHPIIKDGDLLMYYRLDKDFKASDVVVFEEGGKLQTRRVIAVAGDEVDITERGLKVNGAFVDEPDIFENTERYQSEVRFPLTVEEGSVFVLGDAREGSEDSRIYGCINEKNIYGKVMLIIRRRSI